MHIVFFFSEKHTKLNDIFDILEKNALIQYCTQMKRVIKRRIKLKGRSWKL